LEYEFDYDCSFLLVQIRSIQRMPLKNRPRHELKKNQKKTPRKPNLDFSPLKPAATGAEKSKFTHMYLHL